MQGSLRPRTRVAPTRVAALRLHHLAPIVQKDRSFPGKASIAIKTWDPLIPVQ
jgi:hypothetical protein